MTSCASSLRNEAPTEALAVSMTDADYQLMRYEPGLKGQVAALQCHLWSPSTALNTAYFEWKYERNPYLAAPLVYLAQCGGQVIAMRGFFGTHWCAGTGDAAREFTALYADDLVIEPQHRNRGLVTKLMATAFEDLSSGPYRYAISLSPGPLTTLAALADGWRRVGLMQPMQRRPWRVMLQRARAKLARRLPALAPRQQALVPFADVDAAWARRGFATTGLTFEDSPRCAEMAALVARNEDGRVRHVRNVEYLQWRLQNPLSHYRYLYAGEQGLDGYLILQEYASPYASRQIVNIVDWEASDSGVQAELLRVAVALTRERDLFIWSATLPAALIALLARHGFALQPAPRSATAPCHALLLRPIRDVSNADAWAFEGHPLSELRSWDLRMLYSMHG